MQEDESLIIPGYKCVVKFCRCTGRGGGVAVFVNNSSSHKCKVVSKPSLCQKFNNTECFECVVVAIELINTYGPKPELKILLGLLI